jgi:hypothetical protein
MRIKNRVLNTSEEIVLKELSSIAAENTLRVFPMMRLSDVIEKEDTYLEHDYFSLYTRSHFDFLITSPEARPFMAVEFDGPFHDNPEQMECDEKKNALCRQAGLPILRINANHVLRKYRGMTLLRWIIEVIQCQQWFNSAQEKGEVPFDEAFDPAAIVSDGRKQWPYWLSATALIRIKKFLHENSHGTSASVTLMGEDNDLNLHSLEYIRVGDHILYVRTSVRNQDADIPKFFMIREVTHCEMGEQLESFLLGEHQLISIKDFQPIHDTLCQRYKMWTSEVWGNGLDLPR